MASEPKSDESVETPKGLTSLTAIYVDTIFCNWWRDHIRISFAETIDSARHFRAAVVMEAPAVRELIQTLQEVLEEMTTREMEYLREKEEKAKTGQTKPE